YAEAIRAIPYLRAVVQSLRDHWLELQQARRQADRIDRAPGRPDRAALIQREESLRAADRAELNMDSALHELLAIDVYCLDPAKGLALIPFRQGDELAWFVFDLFAAEPVQAWRFHGDPLSTRRPLVAVDQPVSPEKSLAS